MARDYGRKERLLGSFFGTLFRGLFRLIKFVILTVFFMVLLLAGMYAGGFWLLDYLVRGEKVTVPRLYGKSKAEAIEILAENGLMPKLPIEEFPSQDAPAGIVIGQRPAPDKLVKRRRSVTLIISSGAERIRIPTLIGWDEDQIVSELQSAGLELGRRAAVYHTEFPNGTIISQDPLPGRQLLQGKKIDILVSMGPEAVNYVMPNFIGLDSPTVLSQIAQDPFHIPDDNIYYQKTSDSSQWNRIIKQLPRPGAKVAAGESVSLTIGSSGRELARMRMIHVNFPITPALSTGTMALIVWDEASFMFKEPTLYPIDAFHSSNEVDKWIPVFGDTLIILGLIDLNDPFAFPQILEKQFYRAPSK